MRGYVVFILLIICASSCVQSKKVTINDVKGKWYLNQWKPFNYLNFGETTVFVGNSTDTVFTLHYKISHDSLITWSNSVSHQFRHKILRLDQDTFVIEGIHDDTGTKAYSSKFSGYK